MYKRQPLHKLLGGKTREVDSGAAIGIEDSFDVLLGKVQEAVDAGFPRVKLKAAPGWDVDMLRAVRSAFPDIDLHIDCNAGYTLADLDTFKAIDDFNLVFIEQPLGWDDIVDHAELARHIQTPICLDESVTSPRVAEQAVRIGACEYINIKVWRSGWDVDMLRAVRSAFPDIDLHIDCNAGYTLADLDTFKAIDDFNLVFIEQPLGWDDIVDHAELARHIQTPICLDESVTSPRVAEQAVRIGACEYINIKVWRSGGLANAVAIHDIAQDAGIPVWLGGMSESGLGKAIGIELATLPNFTYPNDLGSVAKMFNTNLTRDVPRIKSNLTYDPRLGTLPCLLYTSPSPRD